MVISGVAIYLFTEMNDVNTYQIDDVRGDNGDDVSGDVNGGNALRSHLGRDQFGTVLQTDVERDVDTKPANNCQNSTQHRLF